MIDRLVVLEDATELEPLQHVLEPVGSLEIVLRESFQKSCHVRSLCNVTTFAFDTKELTQALEPFVDLHAWFSVSQQPSAKFIFLKLNGTESSLTTIVFARDHFAAVVDVSR